MDGDQAFWAVAAVLAYFAPTLIAFARNMPIRWEVLRDNTCCGILLYFWLILVIMVLMPEPGDTG